MDSTPSFNDTPTATSIENSFRMAQVLMKQKKYDESLEMFTKVCRMTEKVLSINPGATSELTLMMFSNGHMSDIYQEKEDYKKALAFRAIQTDLIGFIGENKGSVNTDLDNLNPNEFENLVKLHQDFSVIVEKFEDAMNIVDKPPQEDYQEFIKRYQDAKRKDEENQIEDVIKRLNESTELREKELKKSWTKRIGKKLSENPLLLIFASLTIIALVLLFNYLMAKHRPPLVKKSQNLDSHKAYMEHFLKDYESKHGPISDELNGMKHMHHHHHDKTEL